ncbi:MAG: 3'(2'),5'-bisphosphate nucleotidase CysQ [Pseudomonadota bacterium]
MTPVDLLYLVDGLCREAGAQILEVFRNDIEVQKKSDESPVTEADLRAHHVLTDGLPKLLDVPILSEEGELPSLAERSAWDRYWLVDPLDGTRQFIRGSKDFSVNVALIERGRPTLGVVYLPARGLGYRAAQGHGAQSQVDADTPRAMAISPARDPLRVVVSSARSGPKQKKLLALLAPTDVQLHGSSWKSCLVADGAADLYPRFGPTCEWDTAAAQCIVEEAGGTMVSESFEPLTYNRRESLINPSFFVFGDPALGESLRAILPQLP